MALKNRRRRRLEQRKLPLVLTSSSPSSSEFPAHGTSGPRLSSHSLLTLHSLPAVSGGKVQVGDGTAQTVRTVSPAPMSQKLVIGTGPRVLMPVAGGVWAGGSNPGRVVAVAHG